MIVTCEKCDTRFNLPDSVIGSQGAKTRCSKCGHIAVVYASTEAIETRAVAPEFSTAAQNTNDDPVADFEDIEDFDLTEIEKLFDSVDDLKVAQEMQAADPGLGVSAKRTSALVGESAVNSDQDDDSLLELDFSDLAVDFESKEERAESPGQSSDLEFDLDLDPSKQVPASDSDDLGIDFGDALDLDGDTLDPEPAAADAGEDFISEDDDTEIIDLTELGLDDDLDMPSSEPPSLVPEEDLTLGVAGSLSSNDETSSESEFELSDFALDDEDLDDDLGDSIVPMDEIDFDLDFDMEEEEAAVRETLQAPIDMSTTDELDLSDLELAIDDEVAKTESDDDLMDLDFSLDDKDASGDALEFSAGDEMAEPLPGGLMDDDGDLGALDLSTLELDIDGTDSEVVPASSEFVPDTDAGDDMVGFELDMEEDDGDTEDDEMFELLMDSEDSLSSKTQPAETESDDLDGAIVDDDNELDFSDLEDMLDMDSDVKVDVITSDDSEELEFELDIERDPAPISDAELDTADLELSFDSESGTLTIPDQPPKIEGAASDNTETYVLGPEFGGGAGAGANEPPTASLMQDVEDPAAFEEPTKPKKKFKRKRKLPRVLAWLVVLAVLVGGLLYGYPMLKDMGIEIPVVGQYLDEYLPALPIPGQKDDGGFAKIQILENTLNGTYVQNSKAGLLFVVRGRIENNYRQDRSHIQVTAKLFGPGNKMLVSKSAYCGNIIGAREMADQDLAAIQKRLANRTGDNNANVSVAKGRMVPFMVVFDRLPENMERFTVEVTRSDKG